MAETQLTFSILSQPYTPGAADILDLLHPVRTSAELADAADHINTKEKHTGRRVFDSTLNEPVYASGPLASDAWLRAGGDVAATGADIVDKTATINTAGKYIGKTVYDVTNNLLYAADGVADTDTWTLIDGVGSTQVTPV